MKDWQRKRIADKAKLATMNAAFGGAQRRIMEMYACNAPNAKNSSFDNASISTSTLQTANHDAGDNGKTK